MAPGGKKKLLPAIRHRKKPFPKICGGEVLVAAAEEWEEEEEDLAVDVRTVSGEAGN